jgi:hypothetical protein
MSFRIHYFRLGPVFMPVILVIWTAEIGRIVVQSQPQQKVFETLSQSMTGYGCARLSSQLCEEPQIGLWFRLA